LNLKLKRLVRTTSSEQYALFDLDQVDGNRQPVTIGKLDLHYTGEGTYGTILLWDDASRKLKPEHRRLFIQALLKELVMPMGVPNEYVVEFFEPDLDGYEVFHNLDEEEDDIDGVSGDMDADDIDIDDIDADDMDADDTDTGDIDIDDIDEAQSSEFEKTVHRKSSRA
jgi:hypothetical protein